MKCLFSATLLLALAVASLGYTIPHVYASSSEVDYLDSVRVVSMYEPSVEVLDAIGHGTDYKALTDALADTGTQVVFRASWDMVGPGDMDTIPDMTRMVSYVKARLPWVRLMGQLDGIGYCGVINSTVRYDHCVVIDITKPYYRQIVVSEGKALVDAGFDYLMFDSIPWLPQFLPTVSQSQTVEAWKLMADAVKEYARTKYGKEILVGMNNPPVDQSEELGAPYPYQDFIPVIAGKYRASDFSASNIVDDWTWYKSRVLQIYGRMVPIMPFLDYGCYDCDTPLSIFAHFPKQTQIKIIQVLHDMAVRNRLLFVYPLHGGNILYQTQGHKGYDAIEQGTYDVIRNLTVSISPIATNLEWPRIRQTLTNLTRLEEANLVSDKAKSLLANATSTYTQMAQAFTKNDTYTVTELAPTVLRLIASANEAEREYNTASPAITNAIMAIHKAESENRTWGLDLARNKLSLAYQALKEWNYTAAADFAQEARALADKATAPSPVVLVLNALLTTLIGNMLLAALSISIAIATAITIRQKIKRSSN